ncbi:MAG: tRNA-guanine transglycosylase [Limosilactobacillus sp.]|jgi:queuine tRNA-ribosyltransferase|uniref:tRNA-guanine transglycosylase n=2 Tax=Limosilactobacillus sp. TaxID=2773925 RepID=UPI0025BB1EE0|nr:tRNA-guanine transglycosylase [Limosilactobacillus sp.]MCI1974821.1 tRNA-guanine transglycosylase [Limosilactobacillus sp.]
MDKYFKIDHSTGNLRTGKLSTGDLTLATPLLVHSGKTVQYLRPDEIWSTNTKALFYDPLILAEDIGTGNLNKLPNLRQLLGWRGTLFTTSGASEVAKLAKSRGYKSDGVNFRLPGEGQLIHLSPEEAVQLQEQLDANIGERLYRDVDYYAPVDDLAAGVELTGRWNSTLSKNNFLLPVTGGGLKGFHKQSVDSLAGQQSLGYIITQTQQIDSPAEIKRNLSVVTSMLPSQKLRVTKTRASFEHLVAALSSGIDIIYSDVAVHEAVMGNALVASGKRLNFDHAHFANDQEPLDSECRCPICTGHYSRAYLHYLAKTNSPQYIGLILQHNLFWLNHFVADFRS